MRPGAPVGPAIAREVKLLSRPLTAINGEGVFEGYASLFGVADLGKDVVMPGAFAESLSARLRMSHGVGLG